MYPNEEKLSSFSTKTVFANAQLVTPMRKILYIHPVLGRCGAASQARDGAAPRGCPRGRVFARLTLAEPGAAGLARRQPSDLCCSAGFASPSPLPSCPHRSSMDRFLWESASFLQDGFAGRLRGAVAERSRHPGNGCSRASQRDAMCGANATSLRIHHAGIAPSLEASAEAKLLPGA
jgi:hypothetical protein